MVAKEGAGSGREPIQKEDGSSLREGTRLERAGSTGVGRDWGAGLWGCPEAGRGKAEGPAPELASSSCGRTRAGIPPRRPRGGCAPGSAGSRCRGPAGGGLREGAARRGGRLPRSAPAAGGPYLDVLREAVEHLFSHRHGLGKVPLALLLNDILARVVPVEITDGLLGAGGRQRVRG